MSRKLCLAVAVVGLIAGHAALAQEAKVVLGPTLLDQCANAAADAQKSGAAGHVAFEVCTDAIDRAWATHGEQAVAYLDRGTLHRVAGETELAVRDFTRAIEDDPALAAAYNDRGAAFSALHRPAEAARDFTQALALHPANADQVLFNRALAYEDQGETKLAYLDYQAAARLNPGWDLPAKQLARFTVGQ